MVLFVIAIPVEEAAVPPMKAIARAHWLTALLSTTKLLTVTPAAVVPVTLVIAVTAAPPFGPTIIPKDELELPVALVIAAALPFTTLPLRIKFLIVMLLLLSNGAVAEVAMRTAESAI